MACAGATLAALQAGQSDSQVTSEGGGVSSVE
jgi:hypothetical protein